MKILFCNPSEKSLYVGFTNKEWDILGSKLINIEKLEQYKYSKTSIFEDTPKNVDVFLSQPNFGENLNNMFSRKDLADIVMVGIIYMEDLSFISIPNLANYPVSPMWNAYSPWEESAIVEIDAFQTLKTKKFEQFIIPSETDISKSEDVSTFSWKEEYKEIKKSKVYNENPINYSWMMDSKTLKENLKDVDKKTRKMILKHAKQMKKKYKDYDF